MNREPAGWKLTIVGIITIALLNIQPAAKANGSLDIAFSNDGYYILDQVNSGGIDEFTDIGTQIDGLVLVGQHDGNLVIAKITSSGELVTSFGPNGNGFNVFTSPFKAAKKLLVLSDGSFVVLAGYSTNDAVLMKFTSNGILDPLFNENGFQVIDESTDSWESHWPVDIDLSADGLTIYAAVSNATAVSPGQYIYGLYAFDLIGNRDVAVEGNVLANGIGGTVMALEISDTNEIYLVGTDNSSPTQGRIIKLEANGTYDSNFPGGPNSGRFIVSFTGEQFPDLSYTVKVSDIKTNPSGDIYVVGLANPPDGAPTYNTEIFVHKYLNNSDFLNSNVFYNADRSVSGPQPSLALQSNGKYVISITDLNLTDGSIQSNLIRFNSDVNFDGTFGSSGYLSFPTAYQINSIIIQENQKLFTTGFYGDLTDNGYFVSKHRTSPIPNAPTIGVATTVSSTIANISFTAPIPNGASAITGYTATSSPGGFTGTLAGATAGTITVSGLSASTAYTFTVTATNSEGTSSPSAASNSITTSAASGGTDGGGTGGGGTGGGGTGGGGTTTSTTAADELKRQQDALAAAAQKQAQELKEILSLVPTIAGLAQGIAGLGNSLLLPKTCVKGKTVKKVKAASKCPAGYKAKK